MHPERIGITNKALAEACKYAYNDARFVNERAKNDIYLLSRFAYLPYYAHTMMTWHADWIFFISGIMRLDARARQDVAILGLGFLKLDGN